jgi:hypothetical protein
MANENKYSLRWEQDGLTCWNGFMDGAKYCSVYHTHSNGWAWETDFTEDGEVKIEDGFFSAQQAMGFAESEYQEWERKLEERISNLPLELDDEFLLSLLEDEDFEPLTWEDLEDIHWDEVTHERMENAKGLF